MYITKHEGFQYESHIKNSLRTIIIEKLPRRK